MKIRVALTRQLPIPCDTPDCVVVIDVFRSGTCAASALANGADSIRMFATVEDTLAASHTMPTGSFVLAGERNLMPIAGFHCGNSPRDFAQQMVNSKTVLMSTTNGSAAVEQYLTAKTLFYAAMCNAKATAEAIAHYAPAELALICSGTRGFVSLDDVICAGRIISYLPNAELADDGAALASMAHAKYDDPAVFRAEAERFEGGRRLRGVGLERDLDPCSQFDIHPFALLFDATRKAFVRADAWQGRWVLLRHTDSNSPHCDLMLERGGALLTWRCDSDLNEGVAKFHATRSFDHPLKFLSYEGLLSEGKGSCARLRQGTASMLQFNGSVHCKLMADDGSAFSFILPVSGEKEVEVEN